MLVINVREGGSRNRYSCEPYGFGKSLRRLCAMMNVEFLRVEVSGLSESSARYDILDVCRNARGIGLLEVDSNMLVDHLGYTANAAAIWK